MLGLSGSIAHCRSILNIVSCNGLFWGYSIDGESLDELVQRLLMLRSFLCLVVMVGESSCEGYLPVLNSWSAAQLKSTLDVVNGHMVVGFYEILPESGLRQIRRMSQ